ncbi:hydroxyacid dehydrogenase [Jeotgalibaca ciconiae]|uniref:Hydroxyacid dehydrogenase n=1 Tax=Jeotgalibaca ciconiae TaxID=2496265 RepID=A0A3Q9BLH0_9LACT|nr:hydroxyacid dehydrogenase [Jeotgalibaca ciconiae]
MIILSKKNKLLLNRELKEQQIQRIKELLPEFEVYTELNDESVLKDIEVVIHWTPEMGKFWEEGKLPQLKWVQAISAGVNYLPQESFREKEVILTNASGIHQHTISEHIIGVLLYHARAFDQVIKNQKNKKWEQDLTIQELRDKTLMIFGIGNIGRRLATIAQAFGMKTVGVNTSGHQVSEVDETVAQDQCEEVLKKADYVVNILPETKETINFFDKERFSQMKEGVAFVNVGRGSSVDVAALTEALDNGTVSFAALDVFEKEPLEEDSPLWNHKKVLITPHVSGLVEHFRDELFSVIEPNVEAFVNDGKPSVNVVDYDKSY